VSIFFVSDTHFGHANIIDYCNRPYVNVEEMNDAMVRNWNGVVSPKDTVYHLGDVAFNNYEHIERLNGKIKLVPGNHDLQREKKVFYLFDEVLPELTYLKLDKLRRFVLCHYPLESWRREYTYHLHGHAHGTAGVKHNRLDMGVDATKLMRPEHIDDVMQRMLINNLWAQERNK
jgi:calcineurin-like phosphoesterase family protein